MIGLASLVPAVLKHASETAPAECCGVALVKRGKLRYVPCRNVAGHNDFEIAPEDWAATEDQGEIIGICHSHVYAPPTPSMADLAMCEQTGLPWLIVNHPTGTYQIVTPSGWHAPLIGRQFHHGVLDCFTLVRDYYRELGIELPDVKHEDDWWLHGKDLYRDHLELAGFVVIGDGNCRDMRIHDGLLLQVSSPVPNHAAVLVEGGQILQHCQGRLSSRNVYGGYWRDHTTHVLRHRGLM
ncbi:MAG: C40 family peptidase [Zoogloeaceae bacterium]|jgi:proteasome lid subunit RPN8/RPN11|nr:C40 family peptidase [Zoogloeaceae bacterium]